MAHHRKNLPDSQLHRLRKLLKERTTRRAKHSSGSSDDDEVAKNLQDRIHNFSARKPDPESCRNQLYLLPNTPPLSKEQRNLRSVPVPATGVLSPLSCEYIEPILDGVASLDWDNQMRSFIDGAGTRVGITLTDGRPIIAGLASKRCPQVLKQFSSLPSTKDCERHSIQKTSSGVVYKSMLTQSRIFIRTRETTVFQLTS